MNHPIQIDKLKDFIAEAEEAIGKMPPYVMIGPDGSPLWAQAMIISFMCERMTISNPHVGEFRVTGFDDMDEFDFTIVRVAECGSAEEREYLDEFEARAKEARDKREQEKQSLTPASETPGSISLLKLFFGMKD